MQEATGLPSSESVRPLTQGMDDAVPMVFGPRQLHFGTPDAGGAPLTDEELAARSGSFQPAPDPGLTLFSETVDGTTWLRAATFKASVSAHGFKYIPFLGSQAPRNFPVSFRLNRASLGGADLALTDVAEVSREGDRFVLDRGPVDVIYDVALDSVEQSFALDVRGASGDLVLDIDVETDLQFESAPDGGFRFNSAYGGMSYGTAIVLDAAGRRAEVPSSFDGSEIHLTVPAAFVAAADGPILVDPILGTFVVAPYDGDQERPDVAYDRNTDSFIHVYEDDFSGSDGDLFFRRWGSDGTYIDQGFVDFTDDDWRRPSVANIDFLNRSLIVAERTPIGGSGAEIVGRFFRYSVLALEPVLLIGDTSPNWTNSSPDVGGSWLASTDGEFCVVWRRRFSTGDRLRYRRVRGNSNLGTLFSTGLPSTLDVAEPCISKSSGNPGTVNAWNVAFRTVDTADDTEAIWSLQINGDGTVLTGPTEIWGQPAGTNMREIDVSEGLALNGLDPTYLMTYDQFSASPETKPILVCRNGMRENLVELGSLEHTAVSSVNASGIRFGTTATDFLVSYLSAPSGDDFTAYVTALDLIPFDFLGVSERRTVLGGTNSGALRGAASIASRQSGGLTSAWSQVNWAGFSNDDDWDVYAARHVASNPLTQALQYCRSQPNSTSDYGFVALYGTAALGTSKTLRASSLPLNSVGFFIVGNGFGLLQNPGGSQGNLCVAGGSLLGRYSNIAASSGATGTISIAVDPTNIPTQFGSTSATAGQFWQFQCWHRDSDNGVPVSNFTNAVSIRFQ